MRGWMIFSAILGTSTTCSTGNCVSRNLKKRTSCSPFCGTGAPRICTKGRWRPRAPQCAAAPTPAAEGPRLALAATRRQAHLRRQGKSTQCLPPGEWDAPERGRVVLLVPTPRPLPSSVSVELKGACTQQGPCGRSDVRVCTTNAAAALCVAEQHHPQVVASYDQP